METTSSLPVKTPELTLGQRFAADTPTLFKKIGLFGTGMVPVGTALLSIKGIPDWIGPSIVAFGLTLAVLSNFVVKDTSVLANPNATIADYSAVLADLPNQFAQLHAGIANTVDAIKTGQVTASAPPEETPIVKEPVVDPDKPPADTYLTPVEE